MGSLPDNADSAGMFQMKVPAKLIFISLRQGLEFRGFKKGSSKGKMKKVPTKGLERRLRSSSGEGYGFKVIVPFSKSCF